MLKLNEEGKKKERNYVYENEEKHEQQRGRQLRIGERTDER